MLLLVVSHHEFCCVDFCYSKQSQKPSYSLVKNELKKNLKTLVKKLKPSKSQVAFLIVKQVGGRI